MYSVVVNHHETLSERYWFFSGLRVIQRICVTLCCRWGVFTVQHVQQKRGQPDQARSLLLTSPWVMSVSSSEFNLEQEYTTCECLFIFKALDSIISLKPKRLARFTPSKGTTCSDDCWKSASSLSKAPNTPSKWPISERNAGGLDFHGGILLYHRILTALTVSNFWNLFKNIGIYRNQLGFTLLQI